MSNEAMTKIKARITALLAKANGTDNAHEAEAFLAKANDLLQQYQLDALDLVDESDPLARHIGMSIAKSGHAWRWKLYLAVGALYGCRNVIHQKVLFDEVRGKFVETLEVELVGKESAILTADLMTPWITQQVREQAKALAPLTGMSEQGQAKRVAAALIGRIYRLVEQNKAAAPATAAGANALVILDQVDAYFKGEFGELDTIKSRRAITDRLSRAAADTIGLHRQTTGAAPLKLGGR